MDITSVWVPGHPKTKGSMTSYGKGRMVEAVDNSTWRELVTSAVRADLARRGSPEPYRGRVGVGMIFWLDHPDVYGPGTQAGDLDKLARLVLDALKDAGAYADDNQVGLLMEPIKFPASGEPGDSGALIRAFSWEPMELLEAFYRRERQRVINGG